MATPAPAQTKPANTTNKPGEKPAEGKPANGTAPSTGVLPAGATAAETGAEEKEEKARGVVPHMPICVIWKDPAAPAAKAFTAALIHPRDERMYKVNGRGMGGTRGQLEDEGYPIGPVRVEGPKWVEKRIPEGVEVMGYANILGFPLPPQT